MRNSSMRVFVSVLVLFAILPRLHALNVGIKATGTVGSLNKKCSRKCESKFCTVPPLLRYGKYCGIMYGGCPGEKPCDGLDACCMNHDDCIQSKHHDFVSQECSRNLLNCMAELKKTGAETFKGSKCDAREVVNVIAEVMEVALITGKFLRRP